MPLFVTCTLELMMSFQEKSIAIVRHTLDFVLMPCYNATVSKTLQSGSYLWYLKLYARIKIHPGISLSIFSN
jgi:hypothetical protein